MFVRCPRLDSWKIGFFPSRIRLGRKLLLRLLDAFWKFLKRAFIFDRIFQSLNFYWEWFMLHGGLLYLVSKNYLCVTLGCKSNIVSYIFRHKSWLRRHIKFYEIWGAVPRVIFLFFNTLSLNDIYCHTFRSKPHCTIKKRKKKKTNHYILLYNRTKYKWKFENHKTNQSK